MRRAEIVNEEVIHYLSPEYHWDPDSGEPILVFWDIGSDVVDICRQHGLTFDQLLDLEEESRYCMGRRPIYVNRKILSSELQKG